MQPSKLPSSQPSFQPNSLPSVCPSQQPAVSPSAQPSSTPSHFQSEWKVKIDCLNDSFVPIGVGASLCVEASWISPLSSGLCNIRAALDFCLHRVPWLGGRVKACHIILPESSEISMHRGEEIFYYVPVGNITIPIDIVIDGGGSKIFGLKTSRFISTKNVFVSDDDIIGEIWSNFSISQVNSSGMNRFFISECKLTVKNLILIAFGFENEIIDYNGGTMNLQTLLSVSVQNVEIKNSVGYFGGGLFLNNVKSLTLQFSKLNGNIARNGGGIAIFGTGTVKILNCEFYNNEAFNIGGAFLGDGITSISFLNSNITSNKAKNFGGSISLNNVYDYVTLRLLFFSENQAMYGSAIALSKCKTTSLIRNILTRNKATVGGTVYWTAISQMAAPQNVETNTFLNNSCGFYGPSIATEIIQIISDTRHLEVKTYEPDEYPLNLLVQLVDYYGQVVTSESGIILSADLLEGNAYCSYNSGSAQLSGGTVATVEHGAAKFKFLRASCIPGGHMNITFSTRVKSLSVNFPMYSSSCNTMSSSCFSNTKSTIMLSTNIPVTFRNCRRGEIFDFNTPSKSTCSLCTNGYSLASNEDNTVITCQECPLLAEVCMGSTIILHEGTFRWGSLANTIYSCMLSGGCKGGNETGASSCNDGYEGAMCSVCSPGFFKNKNACQFCDGHEDYSFSRVTFYFFILGIVLIIIIVFFRERILEKLWPPNKIHEEMNTGLSVDSSIGGLIITDSIRTRLRLCLVTYQIIIQAPSSFEVPLPPIFQSLSGYLTFLNLDIGGSLPSDCSKQPLNYLQKMGLTTSIPIILSFVMFLFYLLQITFSAPVELDQRNKFRRSLQIKYLKYILMASYFILPSISVTILNTFVCRNYDANNEDPLNRQHLLLSNDLTVDCNSSSYTFWFLWALFMTIIYPIGLPALYTFLLYQNRHRIMIRDHVDIINKSPSITYNRGAHVVEDQSFSECIEFLYQGYSPAYWYWEVVEISRRLSLTAVIAVVMKGEPVQIVIAILIAVAFVKLFKKFRPFKYEEANNLLLESQYQILFTFFILLVIKQNSIPEIPNAEAVIDASLVIVNLFIVVITLRQILSTFLSHNNVSQIANFEVFYSVENNKHTKTTELVEKNEFKKDLNLAFGSDIELVNRMIANLKNNEIEELLLEIQRNLIPRNASSGINFTYYMPEHAVNSVKGVTYGVNNGHETRDIESGIVYLRFPPSSAKYFTFACPFESNGRKYIIVIPDHAFIVQNYPKYSNSLAAKQRRIMLSMEHVIPPPESAMRCFDNLSETDWYASIGEEYNGASIYSCLNNDDDAFNYLSHSLRSVDFHIQLPICAFQQGSFNAAEIHQEFPEEKNLHASSDDHSDV